MGQPPSPQKIDWDKPPRHWVFCPLAIYIYIYMVVGKNPPKTSFSTKNGKNPPSIFEMIEKMEKIPPVFLN